jgi:hypothetical protein
MSQFAIENGPLMLICQKKDGDFSSSQAVLFLRFPAAKSQPSRQFLAASSSSPLQVFSKASIPGPSANAREELLKTKLDFARWETQWLRSTHKKIKKQPC